MTTFNGTLANDVFNGSSANDVFKYGSVTKDAGDVVTAGRGQDTISSGGGFDQLSFVNLNVDHVDAKRIGIDFVLYVQPTDDWDDGDEVTNLGGVTIRNFFAADGNGVIDRVTFADAYVVAAYTASIARFEFFSPTNVLLGTSVEGSPGNDSLLGGGVSDDLSGMAGNDTLDGGRGDDDLSGGDGADHLSGGSGNDDLDGGSGNDRLIGGAGTDFLDGGEGIDTVDYSVANGAIVAALDEGASNAGTRPDASTNVGLDALLNIENLIGGAYADLLSGNAAANVINGGAGDDTLWGNAGNDSLRGGEGADRLMAAAGGLGERGLGNDTYDGGAVTDSRNHLDDNRIDYAGDITSVNVNLRSGTAVHAIAGTDVLVNINVVHGSQGNDTLTGSIRLVRETFIGADGNDTINGGRITDTLNELNANCASFDSGVIFAPVNVDLQARTAVGHGNDTLIGINQVIGGVYGDTLRGSNRTDVSERFTGMGGSDLIDGRGGFDFARYDYADQGVSVNLATGQGSAGGGDLDTLAGVEGVEGSHHPDMLIGGRPASAALEVFVGNGGNDTINGGAGYDEVDYANAVQRVVVKLGGAGAGTASDGLPILAGHLRPAGTAGATIGIDTLVQIEGVRGSDFADTLTGSAIATAESFEGRGGNDTINGGAGIDRASYDRAPAGVVVSLGLARAAGTASDGYGGTDTLRNIDNVLGSRAFSDRITGNESANVLDGAGGSDTLVGGAGNDTLRGGAGNDTLVGGTGNDSLTGGTGLDAFRFNTALNGSTNRDKITDFVVADDSIQLENTIFKSLSTTGTLFAGRLRVGAGVTSAADSNDYLIYNSTTGALFYDADGSGSASSPIQFALLGAGLALTVSDFFIT